MGASCILPAKAGTCSSPLLGLFTLSGAYVASIRAPFGMVKNHLIRWGYSFLLPSNEDKTSPYDNM